MKNTLDQNAYNTNITTVPDFTLLLERADGRKFTYSHDNTQVNPVVTSGSTTPYESASTSKLPSSVILLSLVDQGLLSLDSKPHDLISFWTGESVVTLRHLLSFTSGFGYESCNNGEPICFLSCVNLPNANFENCVQGIYDKNIGSNPVAGSQFYYASTHMQIAGLMAMKVTGKSWSTIFSDFQNQTGLFPNSIYNKPSVSNPRLAGGMTWTAQDYLVFLKALYLNKRPKDNQPLLNQSTWNALFANQRNSATVIYSPLWDRLQEDWSYGLGNWLECPTAKISGSFNCGSGHRNSSPGAYGAYPFIDFDNQYFGILARKSEGTGTFPEGINLFRTIQNYATQWSQMNCANTCLTKGDFDCNTKFDALDISSMINIILKLNPTTEEIAKGDMDSDKAVKSHGLNALINEVLK